MSPALAIALFLGSVLLTFGAAGFFADRLDHVGPRLGLPEAVVGLLTAAAADAPEISSALVALAHGEKQVSLGVVLGSNAFNLAAMVGVSAILAGTVSLRREALVIEGAVGLLATVVAAALVLGALSAWVATTLFAAILIPYLVLVARRPGSALDERPITRRHVDESALWKSLALILPAVALIVVGSTGMVRSALVLADDWHVRKAIVGILVLAVLTSLPNAFTAVRLGLAGRGSALVSETLGSNTINLVGGVLLPALVVGLARNSGEIDFDLAWLIGMTIVALVLLGRRRGLDPRGGIALIGLYVVFVAFQVAFAYR
jgi:cation:H+ antiporter